MALTQTLRMFAAALLCAVLCACELQTPKLASAGVTIYQAGQPLRSWQLSAAQVAALEAWLSEHRSGWSPDTATYVPRVLVSATGIDGSSWGINVLGTVVVVGGGSVQLKQSFRGQDVDSLVAAIGVRI